MLDAFIAIEWNQKQGLAKAEDSLILACRSIFSLFLNGKNPETLCEIEGETP